MYNLNSILNYEIYSNSIVHIILYLLVILASIMVAKILYWLIKHKVSKLAARTETEIDDIIVKVLEKPLVFSIVLVAAFLGTSMLTIPEDTGRILESIFLVVVTLVITLALASLYEKLLVNWFDSLTDKSEIVLEKQLVPVIIRGGKILILVFGIAIALSNAGYNIYSLVAGLGVGGIALAMAARETIGHMFGGVSIFTDKPFKVGDYIIVDQEQDQWGKVDYVGMRSIRIKTRDETMIVIPNSVIANKSVINISAYGKRRRLYLKLYLSLNNKHSDVQKAVKIIKDILNEHAKTQEPEVFFSDFNNMGYELKIRYWVTHFSEYHEVVSEINFLVLEKLESEKIELAYPLRGEKK